MLDEVWEPRVWEVGDILKQRDAGECICPKCLSDCHGGGYGGIVTVVDILSFADMPTELLCGACGKSIPNTGHRFVTEARGEDRYFSAAIELEPIEETP